MEEETGLEKSWPLIMDDYKSIHFKVYGDTRLWTHCLSIPVAHFAKLTETLESGTADNGETTVHLRALVEYILDIIRFSESFGMNLKVCTLS